MVGIVSVGGLLAGRNTSAFSPTSLFAAGEQGAWYDPSDLSTLFQDSAGTTPVTAVDQPVGLMRDKSGRGNHASQTGETSRPLLQQDASGRYYLLFDGSNDSLATTSIDFSATDKMSVFTGIRKLSDAATGMAVELSTNTDSAPNEGSFWITAPHGAGSTYLFASRGTVRQATPAPTGFVSPITNVLTAIGDISGDLARLRINGTQVAETLGDQGPGNYGNHPLYIGARGGSLLPFNGRLYSLIVRGAASSAAQVAAAEAWVNAKTGAY